MKQQAELSSTTHRGGQLDPAHFDQAASQQDMPRGGVVGMYGRLNNAASNLRRSKLEALHLTALSRWILVAELILTASLPARSAEPFLASSLDFKNVFASRPGDRTTYSIVGTGMFRAPRADNLDTFIASWLKQHPQATVMVVDQSRLGPKLGQMDYIWINDDTDNLNVDLVWQGIVPGGMMADGVEYLQSLKDAAPLAVSGPDFPKRVVSDDTYKAFMNSVATAETAARADKVSLWSDRYHEIMEGNGYTQKQEGR